MLCLSMAKIISNLRLSVSYKYRGTEDITKATVTIAWSRTKKVKNEAKFLLPDEEAREDLSGNVGCAVGI